MAIKRIVRWKPSSPVYGRREFSPVDFEEDGIFTQEAPFAFDATKGNWLDVDEANISAETLEWLLNHPDAFGSFTYEEQKVRERQRDGGTPEAEMASAEKQKLSATKAPVEGESASTSSSAKVSTTESTARR